MSDRYALVEYTEFSPGLLTDAGYDEALAGYRDLLGLDPAGLRVREVENGVIPMTDAPFPARPTPRVVRLGTAGGATRPSTGFTFSAMYRQADQVARALAAGRPPVPAAAYPVGTAGWTRSRCVPWTRWGRWPGVLRPALRPQPRRAGAALPGRHHQPGRGGRGDELHPTAADDRRHRRRRGAAGP
ncbi:hypothetical protein GCM10027614_16600 [Micromonospora vulcania]